MGKSTPSCFKLITCAGTDSVDHDDLQAPESKGSSGRGWSFRKRSARHRVLSNTVTLEAPSSANKETPQSAAANFQEQPKAVPEKTSVIKLKEEETEVVAESAQPDAKASDGMAIRKDDLDGMAIRKDDLDGMVARKDDLDNTAPRKDDIIEDTKVDESSIIVIQAAIRGLMAQRLLLKRKSIIKLQAVVRGHVVRKHAIGTLRCVQAIVKMQALIRARRARLLAEASDDYEKQSESNRKYKHKPTILSKGQANPQDSFTYISIDKLLSNRFARQLLDSTPRTEPINIKCDPLKSDSAWRWLERWMSVSSPSNEELQDSRLAAGQHEKEKDGYSESRTDILVTSDYNSEPTESKSSPAEASENNDNFITDESNSFDHHLSKSALHVPSHSNLQNIDESDSRNVVTEFAATEMKETVSAAIEETESASTESKETESAATETKETESAATETKETESAGAEAKETESAGAEAKETEFAAIEIETEETESISDVKANTLPHKEDTGSDEDMADSKENSTEVPEADAKKIPRKASNPSFIAAQSKFEELSSVGASTKLATSSSLDSGIESSLDKVSSTDQPRSEEIGFVENFVSKSSAVQIDGSECGTELSISSTLDSPDRSEIEINDPEQKPKVLDVTDRPNSIEHVGLEDLSYNNTQELEKIESLDSAADESNGSLVAVASAQVQMMPEANTSDLHPKLESETSDLVQQLSPDASPRSHVTFPESQATPSSLASVKPEKGRGEKSGSSRKNKSSSADKKSYSNLNKDSVVRRSLEQKEHKSGKRRNSFGSPKPDDPDQERRDSSGSNSLPSYMQATESARAKAIANGSPRSSPDVNDKDVYVKKRQSLPGTYGRHGSPRIERSLSQAQQNAKGNGTHSPQDRKWRR